MRLITERNACLSHVREGFKGARGPIAVAKVAAPNAALRVIDAAVQVHGGAGVSQVRRDGGAGGASRRVAVGYGGGGPYCQPLMGLEREGSPQ